MKQSGRSLVRILLGAAAAVGAFGALGAPALAAGVTAKPSLYDPALSPDGREIAFVSGGDIWTVPAAGGTAQLLVSNPATEGRPVYSPDGRQLAFTSTRAGPANVYVLTFATGEVTRITFADAAEQLDAWSRDGRWIYFSSPSADVGRQNDIFRVPAAGGTPQAVSAEAFLNEFNAAPSPDGASVAMAAKSGIAHVQWWRNGHSHIDETELWLKPVASSAPYRRLLAGGAKHLWPMWAPDGAALYFMSDEGGAENIWRLPLSGGKPQPVTHFTSGRVLFPRISDDGHTIVFERDFGVWRLDVATGAAAPVSIVLRGSPAGAGVRHLNETSFQELALSPDGKKLAVAAHGQVFAAPAKDGGPGQRISREAGEASDLVWSPDSKRIVYVADTGLDAHLVEYDFATGRERLLTKGAGRSAVPVFSPDGRQLAYRQGKSELRVIRFGPDGAPTADAVLFASMRDVGGPQKPTWSPDGKWLAFGLTDAKSFRNVWVIPAAGGEARPVSFLANGEMGDQIAWSADGKYLVFDTAQRSEDTHLVRIDLLPHVPKYREDEFRDLFKPAEPAEKKPVTKRPGPRPSETPAEAEEKAAAANKEADKDGKPAKPKVEPVKIVFDGIRERATFIPVGISAEAPLISPDGKTLLFRADLSGQQILYSYDLDELRREPATPQQVLASRKPKAFYAFTPDSKQVYLLDGGAVVATPIEAPKPKPIAVNGELNVDFAEEKNVVFDEAWETLDQLFFDPKFNGQDWGALRTRWAPYIEGAKTPDELRRDINLMIGELNASHSGINPPSEGFGSTPSGRVADLGLKFDRDAYEAGKGLVVSQVVDLGPAFLSGSIKPGDRLAAVNGVAIGPGTALGSLLLDQAGKRTVLGIAALGQPEREVVVRPVAASVAAGLRYRDWVKGRRAYVEKVSGGRLGYVHLADMSSDSLNQLYLDLDAQNQGRQGVVIDVRNNNGGFVNGYVLDVFTRKNFLTMTPRDLTALPSRQALGQRSLGLPTVLVTNESSLSDAEDFTEGYRALGLGKVVGVPTAGWIIYTGGRRLVDGSSVRTPFIRIQDAKGGDMEMHPRPVDVLVERPLGESQTGRDAQLDAAVAELLKTVTPGT